MKNQKYNSQQPTLHLFQQEIDKIYRHQQRVYWEADFVNRCIVRFQEEIGLCNIQLNTVADDKELLDYAYTLYEKWTDCNVAYNDTLDDVINEVEKQIANGLFHSSTQDQTPRIAIIIDDGIINEVRSTDPKIQVEIIELDSEYVNSEQRDKVYTTLETDTTLQPCTYSLEIPGYEEYTE